MPKITLVLPLDASQVPDFKPERGLRVAAVGAKDVVLASAHVKLNEKGLADAKLGLERPEGDLRLIVGPDDADDKEILGLQTLSVRVSPEQLTQPTLKLPPLKITPYYWNFWLRWCRWFSVRGRVVCADGSPVPGAKVCAYDIDSFWIWSGHQLVGCDTTDATGSFAFRFRWCCGWWPWWWWQLRDWRLDLDLWDRIRKGLALDPRIPIPPRPPMKPSLDVFHQILGEGPAPTRPQSAAVSPLRPMIDTGQLPSLREKLLTKLPKVSELQSLQIWPWITHEPWFDCQPDIAFRVTQQCDGTERVIVSEPWWRTRWNVDTNLDVTLTANSSACCIRDDDTPPGNCMVLSSVCGVNVSNIGGNLAAPPAPVGYVRPGLPGSSVADTPFAETLVLEGQFGSGASVDYYEFEVAPTAAGPWTAVDAASAGGFSRQYFDGGTVTMPYASFPFDTIDGRRVVETRRHYQLTHPGPWGTDWLWTNYNYDALMYWHTLGHYDNGEYHLRLVAWDRSGDQLVNRRVMPLCTTNTPAPVPNHLVVHLDSRTTGDEPMCKIVDVKVNGATAGPCSIQDVPQNASLTVDFIAGDIDSHLSSYSLLATFGVDEAVDLLAAPGAVLSGVMLEGVPAAAQAGPTYVQALTQGAVRPHWAGGGLRLHIPDLRAAISRSCCYQIELRVYKRAIVSCSDSLPYRDFTFYSVTFIV